MNPTKNKDTVSNYLLVGVGTSGEYCIMDSRTGKYLARGNPLGPKNAIRFERVDIAHQQIGRMFDDARYYVWADTVAKPQVEHKIVLELTLDELDMLRALVGWSRGSENNKLGTKLVKAYPTRQLWMDAPTFGDVVPYVSFFPTDLLTRRK